MDAARWEAVQALFHGALELPEGDRRGFVERGAADDPTLAEDVLAMLAEDARDDSVLDRGVEQIASGALAADPPTPPDLGPYRLRAVLGEGGMGVVYLAERTDLNSQVAIKILRDAWLSPARRERFAIEQRTLAQLNHPSIARLYDADTLADGTPWFAMEYVDGVTLTRYCETEALPLRRVIELFRATCEAVLHAHQHAVIHRDLKPSNILVTRGGQPKLLDFGIAKQLEGLDTRMDRTRTELRLMTPAYAAPEQVRGEGQGVATDVYALGAILYELLTGAPPFALEGRTPVEAAEIITRTEPEKPSLVTARRARDGEAATAVAAASAARRHALLAERGASWADLDVLCLTALQRDPERRYRTVDSLIRDLDHYLRREPLEARPDTLGYRAGKFVRRNWRPLAAVSALVLAVAGMTTFYTLRLRAARNAAVAETARTRRIQEFMNGLFEGGDPGAGPPDSLRVVSLLARGERDARAFSTDPVIQTELYQTLGGIYQNLGMLERADSLMNAALLERRARLGPDHPDVARALVALGLVRSDEGHYDDAERLVRAGLATSRRAHPADSAAVARALTSLGAVLDARGDYAHAVEVTEAAARLDSSTHVGPVDRVETLTELANAHFYSGHYAISDSLNRRVLALDIALHGDRHPHVASDLVNLGAIQQERGHWPEAERYYRAALARYRGWYGEDHYETASTLNMVGRALVQEGKLAEAREPLRRSLAIREHIYGPVHPSVAFSLNEVAMLAQKEGHLDEAESDFRRMIAIDRQVYHDHHYLIGLAYSNLGSVYTDGKRYTEALACFHEALRRYAETLPPGHLYVGITRSKLGRALLRSGDVTGAERESRAGYDIMAAQSEPPASWIDKARADLVSEYETLGRPADAARFRAELADSARAATVAASTARR